MIDATKTRWVVWRRDKDDAWRYEIYCKERGALADYDRYKMLGLECKIVKRVETMMGYNEG